MFEISENFRSIEGEGPYSGRTTIYTRMARCNFSCPFFNNHNKEITAQGYAPLNFVPADYSTLESLPIIEMGCDSQYSVSPAFSHLWKKMTTDQLAVELTNLLPPHGWIGGSVPTILSLTGGEPTLRWKQIIKLINHPKLADCKHILIETNCAVPLSIPFIAAINQWLCQDPARRWTWSNSPKLTSSGEQWDKAIRSDIAHAQTLVKGLTGCKQVDQYFKFVCGPVQSDFDEVKRAMEVYYSADIPNPAPIYIMPVSAIMEQQQAVAKQVAEMCIDHGFIYCHRVHLDVFGNAIGT
jgi:organic radical activating enzyme